MGKENSYWDEKDKRIANAQAWNLAVAVFNPIMRSTKTEWGNDAVKKELEYWQGYFHQKLLLPLVKVDNIKSKDVGRDSAELDTASMIDDIPF